MVQYIESNACEFIMIVYTILVAVIGIIIIGVMQSRLQQKILQYETLIQVVQHKIAVLEHKDDIITKGVERTVTLIDIARNNAIKHVKDGKIENVTIISDGDFYYKCQN